jgi:hypothetical protein
MRNLYRTDWDEGLLASRVDDVRARLGLAGDAPAAPTLGDRALFGAWTTAAVALALATLAALFAPLGWAIAALV